MIELAIRVSPNASTNEIAGWMGEELKVRLAAPPVDGKANEELVRFLAKVLDVPRSSIEIVSGHTAKRKIVRLPHDRSALMAKLETLGLKHQANLI